MKIWYKDRELKKKLVASSWEEIHKKLSELYVEDSLTSRKSIKCEWFVSNGESSVRNWEEGTLGAITSAFQTVCNALGDDL